ncbi:hypothetical protein, partial [Enterobacter hormaechei]|uniref:hypothetical protein n=1 Tax=Enterobacter hormaechei TaxID=158836 RepID=UPI001E2BFCFF
AKITHRPTLPTPRACFFEFPLLFCPSVRKETKPLPTLNIYIFENPPPPLTIIIKNKKIILQTTPHTSF